MNCAIISRYLGNLLLLEAAFLVPPAAISASLGEELSLIHISLDELTLASFGFLTTFIVYGGIMNAAALVMASALPASGMGLTLPLSLIHI